MQKYITTNELILNKTQNLEKQAGIFVKKNITNEKWVFPLESFLLTFFDQS